MEQNYFEEVFDKFSLKRFAGSLMKILMTGATGFVGGHVARLLSKSHQMTALVRKSSRVGLLKELGVQFLEGDLADPDFRLDGSCYDAVIHLGGVIKGRREDFYRINTEGTRRLAQDFKGRFIFISSISARGPSKNENDTNGMGPVSHYGQSKLKAEEILSANPNLSLCILRPPIVYGPGDRETLTLFQFFRKGFFPKKSGKMSFIFVMDLAKMIEKALEQGNGIFYPEDRSGGYEWRQVANTAEKVVGRKIYTFDLPHIIFKGIAVANEGMSYPLGYLPMLGLDKYREAKHPFWVCLEKNPACPFNSVPTTSLKDGFGIAYRWYQEQNWISI